MTAGRRSLTTPHGELVYTIVNRPRVTRRMHLELDADGELLVVVPQDWPAFYTHRLLHKNHAFVDRFLNRARQRHTGPLCYSEGSTHLLAGENLILRIHQVCRRRTLVIRDGDQIVMELTDPSESRVRSALQKWYRDTARETFERRMGVVRQHAPWARDRNLKLALRRMKRTWGTCNNKGLIRLNTHLVKAPQACLDYVIAHELCHLREMNHGPGFYRLQETIWPDWRRHRQHLREHGNRYTQE